LLYYQTDKIEIFILTLSISFSLRLELHFIAVNLAYFSLP